MKTTQDLRGYLLGIEYHHSDWAEGCIFRFLLSGSGTVFEGFIPSLGDSHCRLLEQHRTTGIPLTAFTSYKLKDANPPEDPKELDRGERLLNDIIARTHKRTGWER